MNPRRSIRPATPEDADELAELYARTLPDAFTGSLPAHFQILVDLPSRAVKFRCWITTGARTLFVASADAALVGFCCVAPARDTDLPPQFGEITAIAVACSHRGLGYGHLLLREARAEAVRCGWSAVVLWVVASNALARAFYVRNDFAPDGASKLEGRLGFDAPLLRYRTATRAV